MKTEEQVKEFKQELLNTLAGANLQTDGQFLQGMIRSLDWLFEEDKPKGDGFSD